MNKEKLFSLLSKELVKEDEVNKKIEEQKALIQEMNKSVSELSINTIGEDETLLDAGIDERLNLFTELSLVDITINENMRTDSNAENAESGLTEFDLDVNYFDKILMYELGLSDMYELDNLYIESLLNGKDITKVEVTMYDDSKVPFKEVLKKFVFSASDIEIEDLPNLLTMLSVKRWLLISSLAEQNVKALKTGKREIYDVSILMK